MNQVLTNNNLITNSINSSTVSLEKLISIGGTVLTLVVLGGSCVLVYNIFSHTGLSSINKNITDLRSDLGGMAKSQISINGIIENLATQESNAVDFITKNTHQMVSELMLKAEIRCLTTMDLKISTLYNELMRQLSILKIHMAKIAPLTQEDLIGNAEEYRRSSNNLKKKAEHIEEMLKDNDAQMSFTPTQSFSEYLETLKNTGGSIEQKISSLPSQALETASGIAKAVFTIGSMYLFTPEPNQIGTVAEALNGMAQQAVETSNQAAADSSSTVDGLNNTESKASSNTESSIVSRSINTDGEPRSSILGRIPQSRGPNR